jgi:hypothetical protein
VKSLPCKNLSIDVTKKAAGYVIDNHSIMVGCSSKRQGKEKNQPRKSQRAGRWRRKGEEGNCLLIIM